MATVILVVGIILVILLVIAEIKNIVPTITYIYLLFNIKKARLVNDEYPMIVVGNGSGDDFVIYASHVEEWIPLTIFTAKGNVPVYGMSVISTILSSIVKIRYRHLISLAKL